jgi:hypothetical protein
MTISLKDVRPYLGAARYVVGVAGPRVMPFVEEHANDGGFDLDPDFQRGHVWTPDLRTAFIEHLLRDGEHGRTIVWNSPTYDRIGGKRGDLDDTLVIVDGKQRFTALTLFLADEVRVFDGNAFSDFDADSRRLMTSATGLLRMFMHVHALQWRRDLLDLYLQLNLGAVPHSAEEIARVRALRDASPEIPGHGA